MLSVCSVGEYLCASLLESNIFWGVSLNHSCCDSQLGFVMIRGASDYLVNPMMRDPESGTWGYANNIPVADFTSYVRIRDTSCD